MERINETNLNVGVALQSELRASALTEVIARPALAIVTFIRFYKLIVQCCADL